MYKLISFFNTNNGFVMALLTLVYVVATILICIYNRKTAEASLKQTEESMRQFEESHRAKIIPKFTTLEGQLLCLGFYNVGKTTAENLSIKISKEWITCLSETQKNSKVAETLLRLHSTEIFLSSDEKYLYPICVPADGTGDFFKLCEKPLVIDISYTSNGKPFSEQFSLCMKDINCIINTSDYVRIEKKKIAQLEEIKNVLEIISQN